MKRQALLAIISATCCFFSDSFCLAQSAPQIAALSPTQLWQRLEFRIANVPAASNPFDPDIIRLDAAFTLPSGRIMNVPAFWYQEYQRGLSGGYEYVNAQGAPEWRLRFTPPEPGSYAIHLTIRTNGQIYGSMVNTNFTVPSSTLPRGTGTVRVSPGKQYFETADGQALRLIGENVGWPGGRGTYDYDDWFGSMSGAGENYARIWMCPWAFGIETDANSLTHYRLDRAWQLDYVLKLAEQRGIYLLLCLDYHGMFEVTPDVWGGNNYWPNNPYNVTNNGPCVNQDAFFTNSTAMSIYQKRLRYLVGRYGSSPNLFAWQFLNEIDNVYAYLNPNDVAAWHGVMGGWLHTNDAFGHLVTTSLTGGSDRPELWAVPDLDFTTYHSYGDPDPAVRLNTIAQSFLQRYGKPVLMDEFGTDWRGWNRTNDLYLRGFRQGLWGGALGGSAGTAMSWWWENIQSENLYPLYTALGAILNRTGWGNGSWTNLGSVGSGPPPVIVGDAIAGGQPFDVQLPVNAQWGVSCSGQIAVPNIVAAAYSASVLDGFVHGIWHPDLKMPFRMSAWFNNDSRLIMHLNSVAEGAIMVVRADGLELFRTNLPNLDGTYSANEEYNIDIPVSIPGGKHLLEITNAGTDWFYLDWVRLEKVQPAAYASNWTVLPEVIGSRGAHESLLYVVAPGLAFPANATTPVLPVQHAQTVTLTNCVPGSYIAEWYDPATGTFLGQNQSTATNGNLNLGLPDYSEDLAAILYPPPSLKPLSFTQSGGFQFQFNSETGGKSSILKSTNLSNWTPLAQVTNVTGVVVLTAPSAPNEPRAFYRAAQTH